MDERNSLLDNVNVPDGQVTMFYPVPFYQMDGDTSASSGDVVARDEGYVAVATWTDSQNFDNGETPASDRIFFAAPQPVVNNLTDDGREFLKNSLTSLYAPQSGTTLGRTGGSDANTAGGLQLDLVSDQGRAESGADAPIYEAHRPRHHRHRLQRGEAGFRERHSDRCRRHDA